MATAAELLLPRVPSGVLLFGVVQRAVGKPSGQGPQLGAGVSAGWGGFRGPHVFVLTASLAWGAPPLLS